MGNIIRTRKLPFGEEENPARKRRRLTLEGAFRAPPPTSKCFLFDSLNNDCLVHVLSYLNYETMNVVAMCSRACREARSNEYLDQTRTGTIVCSETATGRSIYEILARWKQNNILGDHPIHLRIENASSISPDPDGHSVTFEEGLDASLDRVVSIDLSIDPEHAAAGRQVDASSLECIFEICGQSRAIDMSGLKIGDAGRLFLVIATNCRRLRLLNWNNSDRNMPLDGRNIEFLDIMALSLDGSCFQSPFSRNITTEIFQQQPSFVGLDMEFYVMMRRTGLTRLSIKNATWCPAGNATETFPVSQEMLIKMVRNNLTLQWLRSDLSAENVAMLQQERPDVTFVSD